MRYVATDVFAGDLVQPQVAQRLELEEPVDASPIPVKPRELGFKSIQEIAGNSIEFRSDIASLTMVFDRKTNLPLAQIHGREMTCAS